MAARLISSSTDGFFQKLPVLLPLYTTSDTNTTNTKSKAADVISDDVAFARVLAFYLPSSAQQPLQAIHDMSRLSLHPDVLAHTVDAETNHPKLRPFNTFGQENKNDPLWTTTGWKALKAIYQENGLISVAYDTTNQEWNRRVHQFALEHAYICTGALTGCPMGMSDGAAKLLQGHLDKPDGNQPGLNKVINEAYRRLISNDPKEAWTAGQWMTERSGGSDVSGTETYARRLRDSELAEESRKGRVHDAHGMPLGPWCINGFKWFSSATDSDMTMMLAQTDSGLSLFYAPTRRHVPSIGNAPPASELNGIRIQRLKDKLGTKSLPTAELELKGVRAYLIGEEGRGVKEISAILNMTRLYTAHAGVGYWARGLQVCRAHARVRKVRGGLLQDNPAHLRWMASETVKYTAATHFAFFGIAMYGAMEQDPEKVVRSTKASALIPSTKDELAILLRLLTPVMKSQITLGSVAGLRESMECLGGVGYCENNEDGGLMNISRVFRDALSGPIWEGTVSVMAEDVVRVLTDKRIGGGKVIQTVYAPWVRRILTVCRPTFSNEIELVLVRLTALENMVKVVDKEQILFQGRELLQHLEWVTCAVLLMFDACTDRDEIAIEIARRWARSHPMSPTAFQPPDGANWPEISKMDKRIFLGSSGMESGKATAKL
ncbi:unnamed protein product [Aureobasidium mustum]|uniref:Acyl-CoA dehydrogenase/oxidase C-terminal n=1 Tax=Aureobasidium mustum TaxID=2773714 RepID=A0A9N8PLZ7_9PEZI|nr:unnamed protein product [Aureobasidium mustum]